MDTKKLKSTMILSDCHLRYPSEKIYEKWSETITNLGPNYERVVLLGDVFDFFYGGSKHFINAHADALAALNDLGKTGTEVIWIEGNHEFSLTKLQGLPDVRLSNDPFFITDWYGKRTLVTHGDMLYADHAYLRYLHFVKNPVFQGVAKFLPQRKLEAYGLWQSAQSRRKEHERSFDKHECLRTLAKVASENRCERVVTGHFHFSHSGCFTVGERRIQIYCQPSWPQSPGYLELGENSGLRTL